MERDKKKTLRKAKYDQKDTLNIQVYSEYMAVHLGKISIHYISNVIFVLWCCTFMFLLCNGGFKCMHKYGIGDLQSQHPSQGH